MEPALETLIVTARNAGELQEAAAAVRRVRQLPTWPEMRAANRDWLDVAEAALEVDLGRPETGRRLVSGLLQREAVPNDRATQFRILASADLALGRPEPAMHAAEQAERVLGEQSSAASRWLARLTWGEAASRAGRHGPALEAITAARSGLGDAGFKPSSPVSLRARRLHGEALLRAGRDDTAGEVLRGLLAEHDKLKPKQAVEAARTLDALGCTLDLAHLRTEAEIAYADASARYASVLSYEHPLRLRARALSAVVTNDSHASEAIELWQRTLADDSPLDSRPATAATSSRSPFAR